MAERHGRTGRGAHEHGLLAGRWREAGGVIDLDVGHGEQQHGKKRRKRRRLARKRA